MTVTAAGITPGMALLMLLVAAVIAVGGVTRILAGDILLGVLLLVVACAIGPGGWSVWR